MGHGDVFSHLIVSCNFTLFKLDLVKLKLNQEYKNYNYKEGFLASKLYKHHIWRRRDGLEVLPFRYISYNSTFSKNACLSSKFRE